MCLCLLLLNKIKIDFVFCFILIPYSLQTQTQTQTQTQFQTMAVQYGNGYGNGYDLSYNDGEYYHCGFYDCDCIGYGCGCNRYNGTWGDDEEMLTDMTYCIADKSCVADKKSNLATQKEWTWHDTCATVYDVCATMCVGGIVLRLMIW